MSSIDGLRAVHLQIIKRVHFPDPPFFEKKLHTRTFHRGARFLADVDAVERFIYKHKTRSVGDGVGLRPICDPRRHKNYFWKNLAPTPNAAPFGARPLPMFPFRLVFEGMHLEVDRDSVQKYLGSTIRDAKASADMLIYPAGCACARFTLFVEVRDAGVDPDQVRTLVGALNRLTLFETDASRGKKSFKGGLTTETAR